MMGFSAHCRFLSLGEIARARLVIQISKQGLKVVSLHTLFEAVLNRFSRDSPNAPTNMFIFGFVTPDKQALSVRFTGIPPTLLCWVHLLTRLRIALHVSIDLIKRTLIFR
ncbi:hypothetical protein HC776_00180 [bacterium]|nr:hypothetical protein [bacterium]